MILNLAQPFALLAVGTLISEKANLPMPGAIVGMLLLALYFGATGGVDTGSDRLFGKLSPHFAFLFLPVASSVLPSWPLVAGAWPLVLAAVVFGTVSTLIVTGLCAQSLFSAGNHKLKGTAQC